MQVCGLDQALLGYFNNHRHEPRSRDGYQRSGIKYNALGLAAFGPTTHSIARWVHDELDQR